MVSFLTNLRNHLKGCLLKEPLSQLIVYTILRKYYSADSPNPLCLPCTREQCFLAHALPRRVEELERKNVQCNKVGLNDPISMIRKHEFPPGEIKGFKGAEVDPHLKVNKQFKLHPFDQNFVRFIDPTQNKQYSDNHRPSHMKNFIRKPMDYLIPFSLKPMEFRKDQVKFRKAPVLLGKEEVLVQPKIHYEPVGIEVSEEITEENVPDVVLEDVKFISPKLHDDDTIESEELMFDVEIPTTDLTHEANEFIEKTDNDIGNTDDSSNRMFTGENLHNSPEKDLADVPQSSEKISPEDKFQHFNNILGGVDDLKEDPTFREREEPHNFDNVFRTDDESLDHNIPFRNDEIFNNIIDEHTHNPNLISEPQNNPNYFSQNPQSSSEVKNDEEEYDDEDVVNRMLLDPSHQSKIDEVTREHKLNPSDNFEVQFNRDVELNPYDQHILFAKDPLYRNIDSEEDPLIQNSYLKKDPFDKNFYSEEDPINQSVHFEKNPYDRNYNFEELLYSRPIHSGEENLSEDIHQQENLNLDYPRESAQPISSDLKGLNSIDDLPRRREFSPSIKLPNNGVMEQPTEHEKLYYLRPDEHDVRQNRENIQNADENDDLIEPLKKMPKMLESTVGSNLGDNTDNIPRKTNFGKETHFEDLDEDFECSCNQNYNQGNNHEMHSDYPMQSSLSNENYRKNKILRKYHPDSSLDNSIYGLISDKRNSFESNQKITSSNANVNTNIERPIALGNMHSIFYLEKDDPNNVNSHGSYNFGDENFELKKTSIEEGNNRFAQEENLHPIRNMQANLQFQPKAQVRLHVNPQSEVMPSKSQLKPFTNPTSYANILKPKLLQMYPYKEEKHMVYIDPEHRKIIETYHAPQEYRNQLIAPNTTPNRPITPFDFRKEKHSEEPLQIGSSIFNYLKSLI